MNGWLEKLKTEKKEQILILLLLGVLLLVIAIPVEDGSETKNTVESEVLATTEVDIAGKEQQLEQRLKRLLEQVQGVGRAEVMITLKSQGRKLVEKDVEYSEERGEGTSETAAQSSVSERESTVYAKDAQGNEIPYIMEEMEPEIEGVLVIAQGANNLSTVNEITEAAMALFNLEAHKIKVMKME